MRLTDAQRSEAERLYPLVLRVVVRMLCARRPARYLRADLMGAATVGMCEAVARGAAKPLSRANGAVLDALRAELPAGYRRPRNGRRGMPLTLRHFDFDDLPDPASEEARV